MIDRSAVPGQRRVAPRRRSGPPPVPHDRRRPAVRARTAGGCRDVDHRLRDVGRRSTPTAANAVLRLPRLDRRQPRRRPGRPRPPDAGLVGGHGRARAGRSTPTATSSCAPTCSAAARARPARRRPTRPTGRPYGSRFPVVTIRDMVRAQAAPGRPPRHRPRGCRVVGGSMGGMQVLEWAITYPRPGALARARSPPARRPRAQQIAWGAIGRRAIRLDPELAGRRLLRRRARRRARTRGWPSPAWSPRSRSAATTCSPTGSAASWPTARRRRPARPVAALRGRALPRLPRRQAGPPLRRQQLPGDRQGDGPARRRPRPRRPRARRWPASRCRRWRSASTSDMLYPIYQQRQIHELLAPARHAGRATSRSTRPTATTPSCIDLDQVGEPIGAFLDEVEKRR